MNDYAELLQVIADKFGTTVEHLWGVMVFQAPLSATISFITITAWVAFLIFGFKFIRRKTTDQKVEGCQCAEWTDEKAFFAWATWVVSALVTFIEGGTVIDGIVSGYFNPEYWALMKLRG